MNEILLFLIGAFVGIVMLMVISCMSVSSNETPHSKQHKKSYDFHVLNSMLFITLIYYISDCIDKETAINYITNALKIGINKGWIELTQDDVQIYDCAKSIYEDVMKTVEEGDV